jgi:phosphoribosylformylglycinamidine synthase II
MAARGDVGVTIDVTKVPVRETGMTPYEILLSESQERMLVIARRGHERAVIDVLRKWDLEAAVIGEVIEDPVYRVTEGPRIVAEFPGTRLVTDCPVYEPEARESEEIRALRDRDVSTIAERAQEANATWTLERLLSSPTIASKEWIFGQYDSTVRTGTVVGPGGDAAVVRLRGTNRALALKTDCNGRYVYLDPRTGGRIAVAEAARNVACTGAQPLAITNCLNFGNPRRPEVYFQLREAIAGMGEACRTLGTPVTGGNVSLYNESPAGAVYPTPVVGMVGLIESLDHITRVNFRQPDDAIVLLGEPTNELGASEYLSRIHRVVAGAPPRIDLERERALIAALLESIRDGVVRSAHDCAEGGLAVAIAECAIADREDMVGATVDLNRWNAIPARAVLFGEAQGRVVISTAEPARVIAIANGHGVAAFEIGRVVRDARLRISAGSRTIDAPLARLASSYYDSIASVMRRGPAETAVAEQHPSIATV